MDKIDYLIKIVFSCFFSIYFFATEQWVGGISLMILTLLNIKWFIRDLKKGSD